MPHEIRIGLAICTPIPYEMTPAGTLAPAMVSVDWQRARAGLMIPTNYNLVEVYVDGEEVGDARNIAVARIMAHKPRPKYLFFLDYDVIPAYDAVTKLIYRAEHFPDYDIFAGVYCAKGEPPEPLIYKGDGHGAFWDWTIGDLLFDITGVHMGLTLIRTSLFDKLQWDESRPLFLSENGVEVKAGGVCRRRGTEDLYFCRRVHEETNGKILVDTSVLAPHLDHSSRRQVGLPMDSLPVKRARWMRFGEEKPIKLEVKFNEKNWRGQPVYYVHWKDPSGTPMADRYLGSDLQLYSACTGPKGVVWEWSKREDAERALAEHNAKNPLLKALDLGAGDYRREWKGYETFTTDLRPDTKPDYVMDSLLLNLPDGSFDLVASSHHLEHIPRFEQERVWSEIFRVCKPGGKIEHIVPNAEWAAAKLIEVEGGRDKDGYEDLLNVLYGAQESHGYERNLNLHFFCYTAALGKALAEQAGFVDVECEGYKQVPEHGYNLVIKGRKAAIGETVERAASNIGAVCREENKKRGAAVNERSGNNGGNGFITNHLHDNSRRVRKRTSRPKRSQIAKQHCGPPAVIPESNGHAKTKRLPCRTK